MESPVPNHTHTCTHIQYINSHGWIFVRHDRDFERTSRLFKKGIMQKLTVFVLALAAFCLHCEAKQFTRCGLVQELRRQGFPEDKMRDCEYLFTSFFSRNIFFYWVVQLFYCNVLTVDTTVLGSTNRTLPTMLECSHFFQDVIANVSNTIRNSMF